MEPFSISFILAAVLLLISLISYAREKGKKIAEADEKKFFSVDGSGFEDVGDTDHQGFAPELDREDDFDYIQYKAEIDHWTAQLEQYKSLKATIKAEIAAVRDYREKKLTLLPSLVDKPVEYMELASWLTDNKRDYSEKREATLQRQLITVSNQIYACQKRIAKAQQKLREVA